MTETETHIKRTDGNMKVNRMGLYRELRAFVMLQLLLMLLLLLLIVKRHSFLHSLMRHQWMSKLHCISNTRSNSRLSACTTRIK